MIDTMIKDGLWDAFNGYHMGNTAENVARQWQLTREEQDQFARRLAEQGRGRAEGRPLQGRDRARHRSRAARATSSSIRTNTSATAPPSRRWPSCSPAFDKEGTVTAANASGINDGAAAVVLMTRGRGRAGAASRRWPASSPGRPPASIPQIMGTGPIPASRKALEKAGWSVDDLDLVEANEAFAAQACAVNKDMGWDTDDRQRQWRRHRHRPSDRRLGRPRLQHAALRDAAARRQEGPCHAVHRRRHGRRHVRRSAVNRDQRSSRPVPSSG